jgi:ADP-dependent NAD(P)H-hydrate dehydratase / NAD(P)H-hydrate epimerase
MRILTAAEMRATDRLTSEKFGVDSLTLMENAGTAAARFMLHKYPQHHRIGILCGRGNNGGDGFVAARVLNKAGREVKVVLLGESSDVSGDAAEMLKRMIFSPMVLSNTSDFEKPNIGWFFHNSDLFLDAVVGTGFKPPLRGVAAEVRDRLAKLSAPVVAVDLPSGWDADSRMPDAPEAFRADAVVTFTAPKLAHIFGNMTRGPIVVADIGSPDEAVLSSTGLTWAGSAKSIADEPRPVDSNKGKFGHVLVIGGSRGKAGAPAMASMAALRAGAGLVTAAIPASILATVAQFVPELMAIALEEGKHGEVTERNLEAGILQPLLEKKTVIAIGPGLGQQTPTAEFVMGLMRETKLPMVIDADALNIFSSGHMDLLDGRDRTIVLTPHPGEMARLVGSSIAEVQANREQIARDFALHHSVTLVLKGWRTLIAHPGGEISVNTSGNPGMAKGGSGDILTGIVAAMLAQYPDHVDRAVNAAVYLHGLAADFTLLMQNEHTMLATDTVAQLFRAFRFRQKDRDGYLYLQGPGPENLE